MSAPVTERTRSGAATTTAPARKKPLAIPTQRGASGVPAAQRATARRDERLRKLVGGAMPDGAMPPGRPQFVLLVMVLLATGLVATLWLSTAAAADSYRLEDARSGATVLGEQTERLRQEVSRMRSPSEVARRAAELGMVPVENPARLVVGADGAVDVVGDPSVVRAPEPVVPVAPADPAVPPVDPGAPPADVTAPDAPTAETPTAETPTAETPTGETTTGETPAAGTQPDGTGADGAGTGTGDPA